MSKSRTKKASYNIVSSSIVELFAFISTMVLPRLILTHYGSSYNGIATSVTQYLSLISVLTLGITAATRVALYKSLSNNDVAATSSIVRATEKYMRKVGLILLIYIAVLAFVYPIIVKTGFSYFDVVILIIIIGANSFAEYYFGITYRTLLLADQSVYISNIFTAITTVISLIVSVLLIHFGFSFQIVKLGGAVVHILKLVFQNIYVSKHYTLDKRCEPNMAALKGRSDAMAHALANIVHDNTDIVVLTLFTDAKTCSVYSIYNIVMNGLKKLQLIFNTGTEPIFGNMWAKKEYEKIKQTLSFYEFAVACFCSVVFSTAIIMLLPFISLYTRGVTDAEYVRPLYAITISLAYAIQCFRVPYLCVVGGIGHYKQTKRAAIIEAAINLGISVLLVNFIGIVGVAVGTLVANLYRTLVYALYIDNNVIHRGKRVYILKMLWAFLNIIFIVVPIYYFMHNIAFSGWRMWIAYSSGVLVISIIVVLLSSLIFYKADLFNAVRIVKSLITKFFKK